MLLLPKSREDARRSIYDDACWTEDSQDADAMRPNETECKKCKPKIRVTHAHLYNVLTVGGSVGFVVIITGIVAWQTFIGEFAPPGHMQSKMALRKLVCEKPCNKVWKADKGHLRARLASAGVEIAYYMMVDMPYNTLLASFIQSGEPMGTFFGREEVCTHAQIEAGEVENCVWEENVINSLDYGGGALWYPAVDRLDEMLFIIWVMGCIWPVWVPTLFYTCFVDGKPVKDENDRKRRKFCKMVFPIMYVVSICVLFGLLGMNFAAKVQHLLWKFQHLPHGILCQSSNPRATSTL